MNCSDSSTDSSVTLRDFDEASLSLAEGISGTEPVDVESLQVNVLPICDVDPTNSNSVTQTNTNVVKIRSSFQDYQQLCDTFSQAYKLGQMNQVMAIANQAKGIKDALDEHFGDMRIDMSKNKAAQEQILQMQQKVEENQKQMMDMQHKMKENQKAMMKMQQQSLDRLAIIQNRVQAVLTQTYELHEYPIPRLFIILPKPMRLRDHLGKLFSNHFRLYFLCECGKHTEPDGCNSQHQVHLAKHEGYDIEQPTEFFNKYGPYILTLMEMFKYGITTAKVIVPTLSNLKLVEGVEAIKGNIDHTTKSIPSLVDEAIAFLESQLANVSNMDVYSNPTKLYKTEAIEGADLRQLESYLRIKDEARVLGNLYRTVTTDGHVKWVCFDHYRETYKEVAMELLRDVVAINGGIFTEVIGKIEINIASRTLAKQFYDAMVKARRIQELDIALGWDATMDDLRKFSAAVTRANIIHLTVDGTSLMGPVSDAVNRGRRYDPIIELMSNGRIQFLRIKNFAKFVNRVSRFSATKAPQLRILWIDSDIDFVENGSKSVIERILDNSPRLVELKLNRFSRGTFYKLMTRITPPFSLNYDLWKSVWRSEYTNFTSRVADHVLALKYINLEVSNLQHYPVRDDLLRALPRHRKKLRKLHLDGTSANAWFSDIAKALATRQEFPMLEYFDLSLTTIPKSYIPWLATFISHPVHDPSAYFSKARMSVTCKPLKRICLHSIQLEHEDWVTVIEAIDFFSIEELYFDYSNFSLELFGILIRSIPENAGNNLAILLKILNIEITGVSGQGGTFEYLVGCLRKKAPFAKINYTNF
ncbi:hypothetical protein BGZ80_007044 [Entomortierella chlamydospora]|uniref:Uncharacterized protein n=1 Tax=Entomortierella chlamydospora TaxID=101097 RepID=A0A9P6MZE9_9FUNG|nr:hypothetical protein BGZ80_007044 [Entomortierella chlamydospora]